MELINLLMSFLLTPVLVLVLIMLVLKLEHITVRLVCTILTSATALVILLGGAL